MSSATPGPRRLLLRGAVGLVGLLLVTGCGAAEGGDATAEGGASPNAVATDQGPDPVSEATTGPTGAVEPPPASTNEDASESGDAVVLSGARWIAAPTGTGSVSVQFLAMAENVSKLVQEVTIEIEMLADDGTVLGTSSPSPFFEPIMPGERLPVRLAGQVATEPAEVVPDMHVSELADFKQERYGAVTFAGQVVDFRVGEDAVGDGLIVAQAEITNTGQETSGDLVPYYLAAFDEQGELVAVGPGFLRDALEPGQTRTAEAEMPWNPAAGDPARLEVHFVAHPFLGG